MMDHPCGFLDDQIRQRGLNTAAGSLHSCAVLDLKIVGGTVVDGTGQPRFTADVGVAGGRIVEVGRVGLARREIHAEGAIVTPGFTDIHTHYDGQISWDEDLAPSSAHGVTTIVMGNCGVGFAPCRPRDRERLVRLMEGVEDIPGSALAEGLTWDWETVPEYMAALDARPRTLDYCVQVTHDPVRVFVMGERALAHQAATEQDVAAMRAIVTEALAAGAVGFSTGRSDNHRSADGDPTPASEAAARELDGIAGAFRDVGYRVLQAVSDFDMDQPERFDGEFDLLEGMARAAGRPLSISLMQRDQSPLQYQAIIARAERAGAAGLDVRLQVAPRAIGVLLGLEATFHPFVGFPSYKAISGLPIDERVARMRDPAFRARMLGEKSEPVSGDGSPIPPLADKLLAHLDKLALRVFRIGSKPDYEPRLESSLYAEAYAAGRTPLEVVYDALLADEGRELLYFPLYNYTEMNLDNVGRMLRHPLALPGLSDGGAHVGTICDASFSTFLLSYWARDRANGIGLERAVQMQASDTSRYLGLHDRGTIAVGQRADLNVIDLQALGLSRPRLVRDLPAGGKRLLQDASGYVTTLVKGTPIAENGRLTGARPGRLVRAGTISADTV
jgi:N-acyl-D-aspartate/D-glutamate deacylase